MQLAAKHMVVQEDLDPKALPASTNAGHVQGAQKYAQIGGDAAKKLLQSALEARLDECLLNISFNVALHCASSLLRRVWTLATTLRWSSWTLHRWWAMSLKALVTCRG